MYLRQVGVVPILSCMENIDMWCGVLPLDSVTTVVPIGNSRSTSSRGRVVGVFARGFNVLATGGGCTDFYRAWKLLSCGVLGLLEVSVSTILCHGLL